MYRHDCGCLPLFILQAIEGRKSSSESNLNQKLSHCHTAHKQAREQGEMLLGQQWIRPYCIACFCFGGLGCLLGTKLAARTACIWLRRPRYFISENISSTINHEVLTYVRDKVRQDLALYISSFGPMVMASVVTQNKPIGLSLELSAQGNAASCPKGCIPSLP